jgi:hypothetical protein
MRRVGQRSPTLGWRIPVTSSSGSRRTLCPPPAWPPPHPRSSQQHAPAPPRCVSPLSWAAWRREHPRPPQALSPLPPPRLWARGVKAPTSRGEAVPHRSPPPPPRPTTSTPKSLGRRVPATRAAETPHSFVPGAPVAGSSSPSCAPPAPTPAATPRARARARGVAGRTARHSRSRAAGNKQKVRPHWRVAREQQGRRRKLYSPADPRGA